MQVISAKILDATHLELSQPLDVAPGKVIDITVPGDADGETVVWHEAAKQHLLDAYADEDAVYDEL